MPFKPADSKAGLDIGDFTRAGEKRRAKKLRTVALVAAIYAMVAGGPFGLEDIVRDSGYTRAILVLAVAAIFWALPTGVMVGKLATAMPKEGGFYIWVSRTLGNFWGFQEAWLTLAGSVFDMALYPTLFALYIANAWPALDHGHAVTDLAVGMIVACVLWNLVGANAVGEGSVGFTLLVLAPFFVLVVLALMARGPIPLNAVPRAAKPDLLAALAVAMWNNMGWDNASTIAEEVERPQQYMLATLAGVAIVAFTYILPILAVAKTGLPPSQWRTGAWVTIAGIFGGNALALSVMVMGAAAAMSTFNALVLSLSRVPVAMAKDGYLPRLLARKTGRGAPGVAVVACAIVWGLSIRLGFERNLLIDMLLTGSSVILEFAALIAWNARNGKRVLGAVALSACPTALLVAVIVRNGSERIGHISTLEFGAILAGLGVALYLLSAAVRRKSLRAPALGGL